MNDIQRYRQVLDNLPTFFIENQRLRFEAVFFQGKGSLSKRHGQTYLCAFAGWVASVKHEAHEQTIRRQEVTKLRQQINHLLTSVDVVSTEADQKQNTEALRNNIMNMITSLSY